MANGAFKFKDNYGNVVSFISGSGSDIVISGGTLNLSGMTGLTLGNITMSGTTQNATSASHAASYLLTSSFNTYSGTTDTIIGSLQTTTGSLNSFTSSATTRLNSIEGKTGSYATTGSNTFNGNLTVTGYIDAQELRTTYISSSILYRSGSTKFGDELTDTHAFTGSLLVSGSISIPGSNLISGSAQVDVMSTTNIARLATTGSNSFTSNQIVTGSITNRGVVIDGANNANVAKLNFTRTDNSWGIHNETNLRIYVGSGNTTSPGTQVLELTTAGAATFAGRASFSGSTLIGEVQSSYALIETTAGNGIWLRPAGVSSPSGMFVNTTGTVNVGTTAAYTSRLNVQAASASRPAIKAGYGAVAGNGYWILGDNYTLDESLSCIGIDYSSGGLVLGSALAPSTTTSGAFISTQAQFGGYGSAIRLGTGGDITFYNGTQNSVIAAGNSKSASIALTIAQNGVSTFNNVIKGAAYFDAQASSGFRIRNSADSANVGGFTRRGLWEGNSNYDPGMWAETGYELYYYTNGSATVKMKLSTGGDLSVPVGSLSVGSIIKYSGRVVSGNAVTGNIATNLNPANTRNYLLICDLNDVAGFSLNGFMNAASYTCWNMSSFYIMKNYSSTTASAGITGQYKGGGCDMNIVDLSYGGGRYIAIGYTSNPEIDVIWTGYRLTHMLNSDGSAQVIAQSSVTVNSTLATY